ncbi:hypothetical protein [Terribacillus saccharophilus]|nr:hypothetical protein [Terribacillus saccharophilus]
MHELDSNKEIIINALLITSMLVVGTICYYGASFTLKLLSN